MRARAAARRLRSWMSTGARGRLGGRERESSHPRPPRRRPSTSLDARGDRWRELIVCAERRPAAEPLTAAYEFSTVGRMTNQIPLSPHALRRRAIFLPAVVVLTVWLLNVGALRTHVGPQHAGFWMFVFIVAERG